ncbi:aspartyl-phosphate phosphatase Spo0E family protein [Natroniella sulfidigena]|uniref:aspartyl-phosphate phosphatase Spo0E family protein n=1 Tax=Natroniella sulfidigena TaxID=723921 RepID=UPI00200AF40F|nr:aspartyl-phosphate phosphatase Spo0E family protein [Natroniella sulfidigena]
MNKIIFDLFRKRCYINNRDYYIEVISMTGKLKEEIEFLRRRMTKEAQDKDLLDEGVQAVSRELDKKIVEMMKQDNLLTSS